MRCALRIFFVNLHLTNILHPSNKLLCHIYVILNKLAQLSTKDYNSEGTACNQETLRNFWFYKIKIVQSFEAVHI